MPAARRVGLVVAAAAALGLVAPLLPGAGPAAAAPSTSERKADVDRRLDQTSAELQDSSAAVQAAAARLRTVEVQLPRAQADVRTARRELAAAQERDAAAAARLEAAVAAATGAEKATEDAAARVEASRRAVGGVARVAYQRGSLSGLGLALEAADPDALLDRTGLLHAVLRSADDAVTRLGRERADLAARTADLRARQGEVAASREEAAEALVATRRSTARVEAAAARVERLAAERRAALDAAEEVRSQDAAEYAQLQQASRWLGDLLRRQAQAARAKARAEAAARAARLEAARAAAARAAAEGRAAAAAAADAAEAAAAEPPARPRSRMLWPTDGRLTSRYGYRMHPIYRERRFHAGIDIGAPYGQGIAASLGGTVVAAGPASGYGNLVVVDHGIVDGSSVATAYAHISSWSVDVGDRVERGEVIARVGSVGNSTGPHLHFEVRVEGSPVDPLDWL